MLPSKVLRIRQSKKKKSEMQNLEEFLNECIKFGKKHVVMGECVGYVAKDDELHLKFIKTTSTRRNYCDKSSEFEYIRFRRRLISGELDGWFCESSPTYNEVYYSSHEDKYYISSTGRLTKAVR